VVQAGHVEEVNVSQVVLPPQQPADRWPRRVGVVPLLADCFQDREAQSQFDRAVPDGESAPTTWVVVGMGGVGKTQLAASFAERLWDGGAVDLLLWVTAGSRDSVIAGYASASGEVIGSDHGDPERDADRLLAWLATTERTWLVVLDDLANPADLRGLWPPNRREGRVVVTTRRRDASLSRRDRTPVEVGVFTPAEAASYFADKLAGHERLAEGAAELAEDLGRLPIALAQAAAYLLNRGLTARGYRQRFAARGRTLAQVLPSTDELPDDHRTTVAVTWALSVDSLNRSPGPHLAAPLLELASVLDANGVPLRIFTGHAVSTWLGDAQGHPADGDDIVDALHLLQRFSLASVKVDEPNRAVKVHALVQRATRESTPIARMRQVARTVADALLEIWPETERSSDFTAALRSNVVALNAAAGDDLWGHEAHQVLFRAGVSLREAGMSADAAAHFDSVATTAHRILGEYHPDTLAARSHIGALRGASGDPGAAVEQLSALLVDRTRVLGADHEHTLSTRDDLAYWMAELHQYEEAISEWERLVPDQLRVLGPDHPMTLTTRGRLAQRRTKVGAHAEAVAELEQVLADRVRVSGPDHPDTLMTRNSLAACVADAGNPAAATRQLEDLLVDHIRVMGEDHPNTLAIRNNVAYWLGVAGDPAGAAARFELVVADQARVWGWNHPRTVYSRNNLAEWTGWAGDPAGAVAQLERLIQDQLGVLAPGHPYTQKTRRLLAEWRSRTTPR
jgi:hypothetical protein